MNQRVSISFFVFCLVTWSALAGQIDFLSQNRIEQDALRKERIAAMKANSSCLFYAHSELPPGDQDKIARQHLEEILKLSRVEGFDSPDHEKILEHARKILLKAPDSDIAHNTHWNIHLLYLTLEDQESAQKALESYIDKYPNEEMRVMEAFDKLSVFAVKQNDWGMALYYADKILEVNPDRFTLVLTKAMALLHLGQKESGKKLLERILNEDEGSVQYNLAMMEMDNLRTGKYNKSSEKDAKEQTGEHAEKASRNITDLEKPQLSEKSTPTPADKQQVSASDPLQIGQYKLTIERMKQLIQGVQMFYLEEMRLPKTLGELLEAGFVKPEFMRDVWGREFHIRTDPANENCWIASGGSDDRFLGFEQKGTYSHLSGQDIIACNLRFVFAPDFE